MIDTATPSHTRFDGHRRIASGSLPINALAVKHALASNVLSPLLILCGQTGPVVDIPSECAHHFISAMAGDMAGFEEVSRALFVNDAAKFRQQTEAWLPDVRDYVRHLAYPQPPTEVSSPAL